MYACYIQCLQRGITLTSVYLALKTGYNRCGIMGASTRSRPRVTILENNRSTSEHFAEMAGPDVFNSSVVSHEIRRNNSGIISTATTDKSRFYYEGSTGLINVV